MMTNRVLRVKKVGNDSRVIWGQKSQMMTERSFEVNKGQMILTNAVQLCFVLEVFSIEVVEHVELGEFEITEFGLGFTIGQLLRPKPLLPSIGDVIDDAFIEEMPLLPLVPLKSETLRGID